MSRVSWEKTIAEVRANLERLHSCSGPHEFDPITPPGLGQRFRCARCGGEIDQQKLRWYNMGLRHGEARNAGGPA